MNYLEYILNFLVFPGFLFTAICGMLASFIDRKVTARVQWRKGPPLLQPLYDFIKLLGKETIIPQGSSKLTFLLSPLVAMSAVTLVSTILLLTLLNPQKSFSGDIIVLVYLLTIPSMFVIIGGFSSGNPLASLGASREMKLILAYEPAFILSLIVPIIKAGNTIKLGEIVSASGSLSGIIALIVAIFCMQAKLGLVPFDMADAEQEIIAGPYTEYSGPPLAIFKLTRWMLLFVLPMFLIAVFMPSRNLLSIITKYVLLLVIVVVIRNTNPRVRIDQAVRFFWTYLTVLSVIAIILALLGA